MIVGQSLKWPLTSFALVEEKRNMKKTTVENNWHKKQQT